MFIAGWGWDRDWGSWGLMIRLIGLPVGYLPIGVIRGKVFTWYSVWSTTGGYMDIYYGSCNLSGGDEICLFGSDWSHSSY